jgi:PhzF family phenazine biosynthesis protein
MYAADHIRRVLRTFPGVFTELINALRREREYEPTPIPPGRRIRAQAFSGNSLTVFFDAGSLHRSQMMTTTQEMGHFESIFLSPAAGPNTFDAHVFDLIDELDFAGHPPLGAVAVLHSCLNTGNQAVWTFQLRAKTVNVIAERVGDGFHALLDQGRPEFPTVPFQWLGVPQHFL